ncbi:hypothetical protein GGR56DRAFT_320656 [Xylariaceae sp. FL0804]|nr:hypothetical protein GGR56DRAFT_320656 [Xylariaceae sp. FL0804]
MSVFDKSLSWLPSVQQTPPASRSQTVCRGLIATPFEVESFEVSFDNISDTEPHSTDECGSTYPSKEGSLSSQNPITGLVIHPPSLSQATSIPCYTVVRLSATHDNIWLDHNLPLPSNPEEGNDTPRWISEISQTVGHQVPRALANLDMVSSVDGSQASDDEESEGEDYDNDLDDDNNYGTDNDDKAVDANGAVGSDLVHVNRVRIWGLALSPGGGTSAVFISRHSTTRPERDVFTGLKCRILFGKHSPSARGEGGEVITLAKNLSTEGKIWEWMYGGGPLVPGVSAPAALRGDRQEAVKDHFAPVRRRMLCVFCEKPLIVQGKSSRCENGHLFDNCASTGVPILAPGVSNVCGVCGSKCLKRPELLSMAPQLQDIIADDISAEQCGRCGGKFIE